MNNNYIIVNYHPFSANTMVIAVKDDDRDKYYFSTNPIDLANDLIKLAYSKNIYHIKMDAPMNYAIGFIELAHNMEKDLYTYNNIEIEVI